MLSSKDVASLRLQRRLSLLATYPLYAFIRVVFRWRFNYRFSNAREFQEKIWKELDAHDGPLFWAANHLTLIDSFLVFVAVVPWRKLHRTRLIPWSTPEYRNYYHLGSWPKKIAVRSLMYLCRCIPFLREGEDEASERWRKNVFAKCEWLLKRGESVFMYPEASRARSGWLERHHPKDFLGRLALEAPNAKFLCVYARGENQLYTTATPRRGETFRSYGRLIPAVLPGETSPRAVAQRLFDALAELQEEWFAASPLPKNCGGNDILDLKSSRLAEHFDSESGEVDTEWTARHLTEREIKSLETTAPGFARFAEVCKFIAAKEAAHKALAQSGIWTPSGAFRMLEADLFRKRIVHLPTGARFDIRFTHEDEDKIHCVAVLRGGFIGDDETPGDVLWEVAEVPPGQDAHDFARGKCLEFIAQSSDEISSPGLLAFADEGGIPRVLLRGKAQDWGVSLSHSGRFAAWSFMIS
ncbi:MAG TPA: 1-acyl-sn-glycerol-3-phosphate acyltransferase [Elusimicrobiota bacterium]|nr:1-acyl-sn-glycerol-3-phosphate acyltransferase [Elusimicrobiota bacterium]